MTIALLILFVTLTAADALLTLRILKAGGRELNQIVRKAMEKFGNVKGMAIVKVPTLILAVFLPWWMLLVLCGIYGAAVGANAEVYYNMTRGK